MTTDWVLYEYADGTALGNRQVSGDAIVACQTREDCLALLASLDPPIDPRTTRLVVMPTEGWDDGWQLVQQTLVFELGAPWRGVGLILGQRWGMR